jgi:hypothetical protein
VETLRAENPLPGIQHSTTAYKVKYPAQLTHHTILKSHASTSPYAYPREDWTATAEHFTMELTCAKNPLTESKP